MAAAREQVADPPSAAEAVSAPPMPGAPMVERYPSVVALQRQIGNRALGRVLARYAAPPSTRATC